MSQISSNHLILVVNTKSFCHISREERIKRWNVFGKSTRISDQASKDAMFSILRQISKVLTYLVMMPCMLGLLLLSKGSFLIAVANVKPNKPFASSEFDKEMICQNFLVSKRISKKLNATVFITTYENSTYTRCVDIPEGYNPNKTFTKFCSQHGKGQESDNLFYADECIITRNYWLWCLYLMVVTPYVFIIFK